jgi:hypothetical protein
MLPLRTPLIILGIALTFPCYRAEDVLKRVEKAVEQSTLDQRGTPPFHLNAVLAPSFARDNDSGRTGTVEIWWKAPGQWRREIRSPDFHQVEILNGSRDWQKNEGDYFPEWLRETAQELVRPAVLSREVLDDMRNAEVRHLMGGTYLSWTILSSNGQVQKSMGGGISIRDDSGLLFSSNGFGWSGLFHDYSKFHNRMVARAVSVGSPEVTAKVITIEDLGAVPAEWFDANAAGSDPQPIRTVLQDELTTRKNLVPAQEFSWPPLKDGPLEGALTTEISIDRIGRVREIGTPISDNPGVNEAAHDQIAAMHFTPFVVDGVPVQVFSRLTLTFKTARPTGLETFDSARNFFERGRRLDFPAAGAGFPYVLKADFQARSNAGTVEMGHYEDTWLAPDKWKREASFGTSRVVRSRIGNKLYQIDEGPESKLLLLVFQFLEPIPAIDTFTESDWRIKSDVIAEMKTVRVLSGYESPEGKLDGEHARGFWFDASGNLVQTYFDGMETRRSGFEDYQGVHVARRIDVVRDSAPVMHIRITEMATADDSLPSNAFELKDHEITRQFTSETR